MVSKLSYASFPMGPALILLRMIHKLWFQRFLGYFRCAFNWAVMIFTIFFDNTVPNTITFWKFQFHAHFFRRSTAWKGRRVNPFLSSRFFWMLTISKYMKPFLRGGSQCLGTVEGQATSAGPKYSRYGNLIEAENMSTLDKGGCNFACHLFTLFTTYF